MKTISLDNKHIIKNNSDLLIELWSDVLGSDGSENHTYSQELAFLTSVLSPIFCNTPWKPPDLVVHDTWKQNKIKIYLEPQQEDDEFAKKV